MTKEKIFFVINRKSGRGRARNILESLLKLNFPFPIVEVDKESPRETIEFLERNLRSEDIVVAIGGDGLFNLVCQIVAKRGSKLWVWPAGTGNDFSSLHFPNLKNQKTLTSVLSKGNFKEIDIGEVEFENSYRFFGQVLSAGFDSKVNARANKFKILKSSLKYTVATILEIFKFQPIEYKLLVDGMPRRLRAMTVVIANGSTYGGGMKIVPNANPNDSFLDLLILHPVSKLELLKVFPKIFKGGHISHPAIEITRIKEIEIDSEAPVYADGEFFGFGSCAIRVSSNKLKLLTHE